MLSWLSWIAAALLGAMSAFAIWFAALRPLPLTCLLAALLVVATALVFPPLWRRQTNGMTRRFRLVAAAALTAAAMLMPIKTHAVKLDLTRHVSGAR